MQHCALLAIGDNTLGLSAVIGRERDGEGEGLGGVLIEG